jgi:hypothetical protein
LRSRVRASARLHLGRRPGKVMNAFLPALPPSPVPSNPVPTEHLITVRKHILAVYGSEEKSSPGGAAITGRAGLKTASLGLIGESLLTRLLGLGLVNELHEGTLVLEGATLNVGSIRSLRCLLFAPETRNADTRASNSTAPTLHAARARRVPCTSGTERGRGACRSSWTRGTS